MSRFLATRYQDGIAYAESFDAADWQEAERFCREREWELAGKLMAIIPADQTDSEEMNGLIEAMNERSRATVH